MIPIYSHLKLLGLHLLQESIIFKPRGRFVQEIQTPEFYNLDNTEAKFTYTEDGKSIEIWYHPPNDEGAPVFLAFHGNTGHWGDVGRPNYPDDYDRRYRIRLLQAIIDSGAGFCALSPRGYGNSQRAKISERGMIKDIRASLRFLQTRTKLAHVVPLGESLGAPLAMHATLMMVQEFNTAPERAVLIAPFISMEEKTYELHPDLRGLNVGNYLRHPFSTYSMLPAFPKATQLYLFHPEKDETTKPYHSETLRDQAQALNLQVRHHVLAGQAHITWKPNDVLERLR